jgi:hypothetical protein
VTILGAELEPLVSEAPPPGHDPVRWEMDRRISALAEREGISYMQAFDRFVPRAQLAEPQANLDSKWSIERERLHERVLALSESEGIGYVAAFSQVAAEGQ